MSNLDYLYSNTREDLENARKEPNKAKGDALATQKKVPGNLI